MSFKFFWTCLWIPIFIQTGFAQREIEIKVIDRQSLPIPGVFAGSTITLHSGTSGASGIILWKIKPGIDTLYLEHLNYFRKLLLINAGEANDTTVVLDDFKSVLQEAEVVSSWVDENSSIVHSTLDINKINANYIVQDVPYLLQHLPSTYSTSDAGNGVGYTGVRIRGLDPSQVNVLINGVALNDAESQSVYWVDLPDLISSASDIQVQRGIGLSGAGQIAFGSSILINTNRFNPKPFLQVSSGAGTFNTLRTSLQFGTGMLTPHWNIEVRLSKIHSNGYIDRARADLYSGSISLANITARRSFRLAVFDGLENTYQAWNGVPEQYIHTGKRTYNTAGTEQPGTPYSNQIDRYRQTHFQFIHHESFNANWSMQNTLHYTPGGGYYEEYKASQMPVDYKLNGNQEVDLVRRRYLANDFVGSIHSAEYVRSVYRLTVGVAWNYYNGRHFGRVIQLDGRSITGSENYYNYNASKWTDMAFGKLEFKLNSLTLLADLQLRNARYQYTRETDPNNELNTVKHHFFSPKLGFTWQLFQNAQLFGFSGLAFREPGRDDYVNAGLVLPKPERLQDNELGVRYHSSTFKVEQNFYFMNYTNQLIPTGKLNDVGLYVRSNVSKSYRLGSETEILWSPVHRFSISSNMNFSKNITKELVEYIDNWDNGGQEMVPHHNQPIAFSPSYIFNFEMSWVAFEKVKGSHHHMVTVEPVFQAVGRQYLDGTGDETSLLHGYGVTHLKGVYTLSKYNNNLVTIQVQVNNLFNTQYESNGWIYRFRSPAYNPVGDDPYAARESGDYYHQKGLFPQAGRNYLIGLSIYFGRISVEN